MFDWLMDNLRTFSNFVQSLRFDIRLGREPNVLKHKQNKLLISLPLRLNVGFLQNFKFIFTSLAKVYIVIFMLFSCVYCKPAKFQKFLQYPKYQKMPSQAVLSGVTVTCQILLRQQGFPKFFEIATLQVEGSKEIQNC